MSGPLLLVLAEITAGTATVTQIARRTGLTDDVVHAAIDHLVRAGRLTTTELSLGCPPGGCGTCLSSVGCSLPPTQGARRPGLVSLSLTARPA